MIETRKRAKYTLEIKMEVVRLVKGRRCRYLGVSTCMRVKPNYLQWRFNLLQRLSTRKGTMYRIGLPGWKLAARFGVRLLLRVQVIRDDVAGVLVATSPDLPGLVVEAKSSGELIQCVYDCADLLIDELVNVKAVPYVAWDGRSVSA